MVKAIYVVIVVIIILILLFIVFNKSSQHGGDITTNQETDNGHLTKDVMSIVGKYFKSPADYANLSKLSKKYNDITGYYHYNPIHTSPDLFPNIQTYEIRTEDEMELNYRPGIESLSSCIVPEEIDFTVLDFDYQDLDDLDLYEEDEYDYYIAKRIKYYLSYYVVLNDFITKLNVLVEEYPHIHVFKYLPPIYFNFELLNVSKKVIFENIKGTVPYGVDIKRFKTITMGLGDKSLIKKLKTKLNTEITEAVIPEGIIYLTDMLGYDKLISIKLPSTLRYIGIENECPNLHNLYLPDKMNLEIHVIKNTNINNVSVCAENNVKIKRSVIKNRDKPINITFRNAGQYSEDLSISLNDPDIYNYIMENYNVVLFVKNGELYLNSKHVNMKYILTEAEIDLLEIPDHGPLSRCKEIPNDPNSDYYKNYYKTIHKLVKKLNELAKKDYIVIRYYPKINFDAELLNISKKVIFENIRGMVPYGVDVKRFKTTFMGLSDKSLIKELNLNTEITEAVIPEGIIYLRNMLGYDKLTSIQLPSTITSIHLDDECPELHNLSLSAGMDLDLYDIARSNINHINVDANSKVLTHGYRLDGEKIINITFKNAGQHNEDLTIALHDDEQIEWLFILNGSSIEVINGEICIDGSPISELYYNINIF